MINKSKLSFEQGPIRPPNEARSFLLRITRNCPWNKCLFCPVYKERKFSLRTVEEIKKDIQAARDSADDIKSLSWKIGEAGLITNSVISHILNNNNYSYSYKNIALWHYYGTRECFLQDADNFKIMLSKNIRISLNLNELFTDWADVMGFIRQQTSFIITKSLIPKSIN